MLARCHYRLAVAVALLGQLVVTFGLPVPISTTGLSACGCAPTVREAGCCCCHPPAAGGCCAAEPEPVSSCCQRKAGPAAGVTWVGGVLSQKCRGPLDAEPTPATDTALPPNPPTDWSLDPAAGAAVVALPTSSPGPSPAPDSPPPRAFAG